MYQVDRHVIRREITQECAFVDIVDIAPHLGVKSQNCHFWGMNRHFQAKTTQN